MSSAADRHRMKQNAHRAEKRRAKVQRNRLKKSLPKITEDDLLAFQFTHFGDESYPASWFVDAETAANFEPEYQEEDDGLGHYDDGVKRTLTDEQIAMFRRTELYQMKRAQDRQKEDNVIIEHETRKRAASPASDVSSLEDELLAFASVSRKDALPTSLVKRRQSSHSRRSESASNSSESRKQRRPRQQIPYNQRNKRKWEGFIDGEDPIEGSLTHRRIARELDRQQTERIEMDY